MTYKYGYPLCDIDQFKERSRAFFFSKQWRWHDVLIMSPECGGQWHGQVKMMRTHKDSTYSISWLLMTWWCNIRGVSSHGINPLRAKFVRGNINIYLHFMSLLPIDMAHVLQILPQDRDLHILHSQYHCCWCRGDVRSQGISSHGTDLVKPR